MSLLPPLMPKRSRNGILGFLLLVLVPTAIFRSPHKSVLAYKKIKLSNEFFNQNIPEEEALLTEEDFLRMADNRRIRRQSPNGIEFSLTFGPKVNDSEPFRGGYKWPNGKIPYTISKQYTPFGREKIAEAINEYHSRTCVQFIPKTATDTDYIHILPDDGCYSLVGKVGGKQPLSLGDGCLQKGIIIHELTHAVGFFHEQSREDRDMFVTIKWENVEAGLQDQFDKYTTATIDTLGAKYDYGSVMHYGPTAFSKNGQPTIVPNQPGAEIGQRVGFSKFDVYKVNKLYGCPSADGATAVVGPSEVHSTCVDQRPDCIYLVDQGFCANALSSTFMQVNCMKSCGKCEGQSSSSTVTLPGTNTAHCSDQRPWCHSWATAQLCNIYLFAQYMRDRCSKSCGLCS